MQRPIRVGITHGDINGISYEVILKTLGDERMTEICTPVVFGSGKLVGYYRKALGIEDFNYNTISSAEDARDGAINIVNISEEEFRVDIGRPTLESGRAAVMALDAATEALCDGQIDVLVTAPISKDAVHQAGFEFPGHTEYLQARLGEGSEALMVLFSEPLRVALATTHMPLSDVAGAISADLVEQKVRTLDATLRRDFRIERPRIAVLSVNPHNGDNGVLGSEETEKLAPALEKLIEDKILVFGPYAADGFFGAGMHRKFDGILAMYHDQGLTPFKALAGQTGVNFTAGLEYIRTSPDHGTGYDIAGRGEADPTSMREAIYEAIDIYRARAAFDRASANPLRKQYVERGADKTIDPDAETL